MSRYRSDTDFVEAVPFDGTAMGAAMLRRFAGEAIEVHPATDGAARAVTIYFGERRLDPLDWLVRESSGALRSMPATSFAQAYRAV